MMDKLSMLTICMSITPYLIIQLILTFNKLAYHRLKYHLKCVPGEQQMHSSVDI